jgi:HAD superfamily hydrolase (TIGR01549 family)
MSDQDMRAEPRSSKAPSAVVFDVYGTLCDFDHKSFLKDLKRALGTGSNRSADSMRRLLTVSYTSEAEMLSDLCCAVGVSQPLAHHLALCREVVERYQSSVTVREGVPTLLSFLHRRGVKIAVLSNASQAFAALFNHLSIADLFDHLAFSCEIGTRKPFPGAYLGVCQSLGVTETQCIFVGDSVSNDYTAPRSLGMNALCLRPVTDSKSTQIERISDIAWRSLQEPNPLEPLIGPKTTFKVGQINWNVESVCSLRDDLQGRYNIVASVMAVNQAGTSQAFIAKRYLWPNSAHVESLAYQVMEQVGLSVCRHVLVSFPEHFLVMEEVQGMPWARAAICEEEIRQIGSHCAMAYIIANADLRPRNTFVSAAAEQTRVSVIDLEHCFFDRAIVLPSDVDPFNPRSIDKLPRAILEERTRHRALSRGTIRRARRAFVSVDDKSSPQARAFREGWLETYHQIQKHSDNIADLLIDRLYKSDSLIIGTQSYRRALSMIDIDDMQFRIRRNPDVAFEELY